MLSFPTVSVPCQLVQLPNVSSLESTRYYLNKAYQGYLCPGLDKAALCLEGLCFSAIHFEKPNLNAFHLLITTAVAKTLLYVKDQSCFKKNNHLLKVDFKLSLLELALVTTKSLTSFGDRILQDIARASDENQDFPSFIYNTSFVRGVFAVTHLALLYLRHYYRS